MSVPFQVRLLNRLPLWIPTSPLIPVRAASGLLGVGESLWTVQDDTPALIRVLLPSLQVEPPYAIWPGKDPHAPLPKREKWDLEALCWLPLLSDRESLLIAWGSGSRSLRESVLLWPFSSQGPLSSPRLEPVPALYAILRKYLAPAGELNIEGALWLPQQQVVRFFHRGHALAPNAFCDLPAQALLTYLLSPSEATPPTPTNHQEHYLGDLRGVPLSWTDATLWQGMILFSATAEVTSNAYDDGAVVGSAIGYLTPTGETGWTPLTDSEGNLLPLKVEGLAPDPYHPQRLYLVTDPDDPTRPAELLWVELLY